MSNSPDNIKDDAMINLRKILVTTDLSEHSLAAFEHAFSFGLLYASKVYVLYVVDNAPPLFTLYGLEGDTQLHAARVEEAGIKKLDQFILTHIGTERKVHPIVRNGVSEHEIMRFAEEEGVDLIVMATHGWTGVKHMLMGKSGTVFFDSSADGKAATDARHGHDCQERRNRKSAASEVNVIPAGNRE
jgi:universal stress protein A